MNKKVNDDEIEYLYNCGDMYIRSTKHEFNTYLNTDKLNMLSDIIDEYKSLFIKCLNEVWNKNIKWEFGFFNFQKKVLNGKFPKFFRTSDFSCIKNYKGLLSGRLQSILVNHLCGMLKGIYKSYTATGNDYSKPKINNLPIEIPPKFVDFRFNDKQNSIFGLHVALYNLFKIRNYKTIIPIKLHKMNDKYEDIGDRIDSILLTKKSINIRYEIRPNSEVISPKNGVKGADMGINKILSLSDGQTTDIVNKNGRSFNDIVRDINRCYKGSKRYKRKLNERDCFINEVIDKLDIDCAVLRLESNKEIKQNTNNSNHYWRTECIIDKILRKSQDRQVSLLMVKSYYKSQRCFKCGYTHTNNRHSEEFKCLNCFYETDADVNSAMNNSITLPYDGVWKLSKEERKRGFFWLT